MKTWKQRLTKLVRSEEGATMVEYAIMVALIAVVSILVVKAVGTKVSGTFDNVSTQLQTNGVPTTTPTPATN